MLVNLQGTENRYVAGVHTVEFDQVYAPQNRSMRFWAASISMLMKYHNLDIDQNSLARDVCGINPLGFAQNCQADDRQMSRALDFYVDSNGYRYQVNAPLYRGVPGVNDIINQLSHRQPILIAYNCGNSIGHSVVITGCQYQVTNQYTILEKLYIRDPANTFHNRMKKEKIEITNVVQFLSCIKSYWLVDVRVQRINQMESFGRRWF